MRRLAIAVLLSIAAGIAFAADDARDTATVTVGLTQPSHFALAWPEGHKDTYPVNARTGLATVPVLLRFYLSTLPEGYDRGDVVFRGTYEEQQFDTMEETAAIQDEVMAASGWPRVWMQDPRASRTPTQSTWIWDQWHNLDPLVGGLTSQKATLVAGARVRMRGQTLATDFGGLPMKLHVELLKATPDRGSTWLTMGESYLEWELPDVKVSLSEACDTQQLFQFSVKKRAATEGGPETPSTSEQTTPNQQATTAWAKLKWPADVMTRSIGYDPVVGFAVPKNGPQGMAGIVVSFENSDDELRRPWDWRRIGLLGGWIGGSDQNWVLAPTYKIGSRAHLYGGAAFGNSDSNTCRSLVFGLAYSASGILDEVSGKEKQQVSSSKLPTAIAVELDPKSMCASPAVRYRHDAPGVFLVRGDGLKDMRRAGLILGDRPQEPLPFWMGYLYKGEGLIDGTEVTGAWGCDKLWSEGDQPVRGWSTDEAPDRAYPYVRSNDSVNASRRFDQPPTAVKLHLNNAEGEEVTDKRPLVLKKGIVYFCEIVLHATTQAPPEGTGTGTGTDRPLPPTPQKQPTGPQWWLRGQADPPPGQMVSIIITATSEKKVGSGTLQSRTPYSVPAQVDADGFFAVLLPQLEEGRSYRIEITREGIDDQFMVDGVTPEKGKNLPITLPEVRKPAPK